MRKKQNAKYTKITKPVSTSEYVLDSLVCFINEMEEEDGGTLSSAFLLFLFVL